MNDLETHTIRFQVNPSHSLRFNLGHWSPNRKTQEEISVVMENAPESFGEFDFPL